MMSKMILTSKAYGETLTELAVKNKDIFVVEADLMKASGSRPFMERFPDRHINVGVAEQNLVGVAAGLASMKRIPFACTMANFISQRACDQVAISVAYNKFNVKLIGCYSGLSQQKNGGTHIGVMDIAVMRCLPNMRVIVPADIVELKQVIEAISEDGEPTYVRLSKILPESIFDKSYNFRLDGSYQIGNGRDITIIPTGISVITALESIPILEKEGIKARILHIPSVKPVDREAVIRCSKETRAIVTMEDHSVYGGIGSLVSEIVTDYNPVRVSKLGFNDVFGLTADIDFQLEYFGLTSENLVRNIKQLLPEV